VPQEASYFGQHVGAPDLLEFFCNLGFDLQTRLVVSLGRFAAAAIVD